MKLQAYLERDKIPVHTFAKRCGITAAALYRIMKGVEPTIGSIAKIAEATNGVVSAEDLMSMDNLAKFALIYKPKTQKKTNPKKLDENAKQA